MAKTIQKSIKEMAEQNFTEISLGKERLFSGKFSPTLEIILVFNENVENAEMNLNCNWTEIKRKRQIQIHKNGSNDEDGDGDIGTKKKW